MARVNIIWLTAVAGKADMELTLSASAYHIGGPKSVNPGQMLLVYGILDTKAGQIFFFLSSMLI